MSTIDSGHYGDGVARRTKRLWTDEEKRSICFQTAAPGVSVAQVARRYAVNANLIFKWLRDPRYAPDPTSVAPPAEEARFLPVEIVAEPRFAPAAPATENHIEIELAGGDRMRISGSYDPEELRSFTARLLAEVKAQAILIEKLRHQLAGHRAHRFGASSETAEQLQLALETSEIAAAAMTARMKLPDIEENDKPRRRPIPDQIPRMEVELTPGSDACAECGGRLRRIGEDVTEELEYVPGRFIVNRIVRPRLTCACCEGFVQAPLPSRPIERGRPGPGLLAHVLVSKYADHLPLYRQSQIFDREGLNLDRSTLADWVGKSTALLEPLADAIGRHVLSAEAIFADDTPVSMLAPGTGKTQTARLWTYARDERPWGGAAPPAAWYRFSGDRKGQHPKDHLARYRGWMHADGYAGFEDLYRTAAIREVACMAHVRRKFVDIHRSQGSPIAEEAIGRIAQLYAVEKEARGSPPGVRVELRKAHAAPVFDNLEVWLAMQLTTISGKSPIAAAIRYALTRMERLRPYLDNGILELDNNAAERGMRAIALGRKNYLFVGSEAGGKAAAIAYTLIQTVKLNAIDAHAWLADTLARIPDYKITKVNDLMPWRWNG